MAGNWVAKALGKTQPVQADDASSVQSEPTMLLIQGRNTFGDDIYTYVRLPMNRIDDVKKHLSTGQNFVPGHFGTVVAAGRGKPTPDVTEEVGIPEFMIYFEPKAPLGQQNAQRGGYG